MRSISSVPPVGLIQSSQLLRVLATDWTSTTGVLQRFSRSTAENAWKAVGAVVPVSLGGNGLVWGLGLHADLPPGAPSKQEGDGCAPAGVFALTSLFGEAGAESLFAQSARLPYLCAT
mgnify:FL=1